MITSHAKMLIEQIEGESGGATVAVQKISGTGHWVATIMIGDTVFARVKRQHRDAAYSEATRRLDALFTALYGYPTNPLSRMLGVASIGGEEEE